MVKGMEAQKAGRNEEALKLLNAYVDRYPQVREARYYRALALNGLGRHKEALEDVDKALADNPGNVNFLLAKGNILVALERRPEAILIYTQAMQCDPRNPEACKERGDCLAQEGQFAEAMADLNKAAGLAPKDPWVFNKRGMVWFCQGEYQKAVADFTTRHPPATGPGNLLFFPGQYLPAPPEGAGEGYRRLPEGLPPGKFPVLRGVGKDGGQAGSRQPVAGYQANTARACMISVWSGEIIVICRN